MVGMPDNSAHGGAEVVHDDDGTTHVILAGEVPVEGEEGEWEGEEGLEVDVFHDIDVDLFEEHDDRPRGGRWRRLPVPPVVEGGD